MPDNKTLLFSVCYPVDAYLHFYLYTYNTETEELTLLDQGLPEETVTSDQIAQAEEKYNKQISVPYDFKDRYSFTELTYPRLSKDGQKVLYSTSYNRSSTPAYDADSPEREHPKLWLLSGLWNCNTDSSGSPELIYANPDAQTNLSPAIWSYDQTEIYFGRYYDTCGSDSSIENLT